ncbi:exonuclease SbcC [Nitrosopumilus sp.]|nr:exonuclease SbcC [Nitrosopumilus sp.]|tara:strand:+ start:165 stop:1445 length:1281 start_codon:yes stop_codon:yes gene_type:complete
MVFGWGKKKQVEEPVERKRVNQEIGLSEVPQIINDLRKLRESQTISEIKHLRNDTAPLIDDLMKIGIVLDKDDLNIDDIDKHLAIIVVRGKKQVIDILKKDVKTLIQVSNMDDAKKLDYFLTQLLKKVGDVLGRQTRVIHIFAKKYANQLTTNLKIMNENSDNITKLLKHFDSTQSSFDEIDEMLNKIESLKQDHVDKTKRNAEIQDNLKSLQEKNISLQKSLDEIHASENYKNYVSLQNKLNDFIKQKSKIKSEIDTQFTKISRPLGRYAYASSLDKEQTRILSTLVDNPFDALIAANLDSIILILENIRKGISSGSISVKDTEKTLSQLTETEESLDGFIKKVSEYSTVFDSMEADLKNLKPQNLTSTENDISKTIDSENDARQKSKTILSEISEIESQIPQFTSKIESKLKIFSSTRYTISKS